MIRTCLQPGWQPPPFETLTWTELQPPKAGSAPSVEAVVQIQDEPVARMWANELAIVSASPGRLVVSTHYFTREVRFARLRSLIALDFAIERDEPDWKWRRGSNKIEIAKRAGQIPEDTIHPPLYFWHYMDPKEPT